MNLIEKNDIDYLLAYSIIPYEILTPIQKFKILLNFDFDIKRIFSSNIKEINQLLKKNIKLDLDVNLYKYLNDAKNLLNKGVKFITTDSKFFPFDFWKKDLSEIKNYFNNVNIYETLPFLLFYEGNIEILNTEKISIVGTRRPDEISINFTSHLVKEIKKTVVSGFAVGIDHYAHYFAFKNNIPTIAIFACGTNIIYPKSNLELYKELYGENFLILSEFPPDTIPKKYYFPIRNRIISYLSDNLICIQAGEKSGALITTDYAKKMNKNIFVFYPIDLKGFEGNKKLYLNSEASLIFAVYKEKFYVKKPSFLSNDYSTDECIDIKIENISYKNITNKNITNDEFDLLKMIFIYPLNTLEYYAQVFGKGYKELFLAYQSLLEKNLIVIDKINKIYPNYENGIFAYFIDK